MTEGLVLAIFQAWAIVLGLVIGSFLNVVIVRIPDGRSVVWPRSHCPRCGTQLAVADLVPVASWVALGGKCRTCASPISPAYPLVETLTGLLAWLLFRRTFPTVDALDAQHVAVYTLFFAFLCLLVVASLVDVRHWIIPDETSIFAAPFGILGMAALQAIGVEAWPAIGWKASVIGALVGGSALATTSIVSRWVFGRDALGWGDVKLLAMIGSFVGPLPVIFLVLLPASMIGAISGFLQLIVTRRRGYLPFGPSLALAAAIYVFYGDALAKTYFPLIALQLGLIR